MTPLRRPMFKLGGPSADGVGITSGFKTGGRVGFEEGSPNLPEQIDLRMKEVLTPPKYGMTEIMGDLSQLKGNTFNEGVVEYRGVLNEREAAKKAAAYPQLDALLKAKTAEADWRYKTKPSRISEQHTAMENANQILNKYGTFEELVASGELGQWDFYMGVGMDNWKPIAVQKAAIEEIVRAEEIQAGVPKFVTEAEVQKEVASRLNSLLNYLKKTTKISSAPGNAMGGKPRVARQMGNPNPTMNIGMTEQIDTPQGDMSMTEDVSMTEQMPGQANNDPYTLLRTRLPQEISDDVVRLIAYNPDAFADFASIETQEDVIAFNQKWGVELVVDTDI